MSPSSPSALPSATSSSATRAAYEAAATALVVFASFLSGAIRVQLGAITVGGALAAAAALGLANALAVWTFGPRGARLAPWISAASWGLGGGSLGGAVCSLGGQVAGGVGATLALARLLGEPPLAGSTPLAGTTPLREGVATFLFVLVALSVAHARDVRVPVALGMCGAASLLATGSASGGNPFVLLAAAWLAVEQASGWAQLLVGQALGAAVGAGVAVAVFPWWRASAAALLFSPQRGARR
jgi:hypothetical protein